MLGGDLDRTDGPRRDLEQGQAAVGVDGQPPGGMASPQDVACHDRRETPGDSGPGRTRRWVDPNREDIAPCVDHDSRGQPPRAGRGLRGDVLEGDDRLSRPRHSRRHAALQVVEGRLVARLLGRAARRTVRRVRSRIEGRLLLGIRALPPGRHSRPISAGTGVPQARQIPPRRGRPGRPAGPGFLARNPRSPCRAGPEPQRHGRREHQDTDQPGGDPLQRWAG